jgi:hypothetical protein
MAVYARHDLDQERTAIVMHRTWELAMGGTLQDCRAVLEVLRREGHEDAARLLRSPGVSQKVNEVCAAATVSRSRSPLEPHKRCTTDEEAIWQLLAGDYCAFWRRDFDGHAACYVQSTRFRFQAWVREEGMTLRDGWATYAARVRENMARDPLPNPFFAFGMQFERRNLTIGGDLAWCTCEVVFPTRDLPGFRGPEVRL